VDQQQLQINMDSLDFQEEQAYRNLSSNYLEYLVKVINTIQLCNSSINRQPKEHDSQTISNKAIIMQDKILNQIMAQ
jgi:hypothetical protein